MDSAKGVLLVCTFMLKELPQKGYLNILFSCSSTSFPGNSGRPAFASSVTQETIEDKI